MFETVFRGTDLPAAERFECWRQMACASHAPTELRTDHAADFDATLRLLELGPVQVSMLTCPPLRSHRTSKLVRQNDPELYNLSLTRRGCTTLAQSRHEAALSAGDLVLSTTSRPYQGQLAADQGTVALAQILIPRKLLPLPADTVDRLLAVRLPSREGLGALLAQFVTRMATDTTRYAPADASRLGAVTLDLAAALLAHHLDTSRVLPPETRRLALAVRVQAFIHQYLGDPQLAPAPIAAAHHISPRSLHRLFQNQGTTVTAYIRHHRLERARHDLADPTQHTRPIHTIATRWGFTRPADFTRAFRTTYGIPPREYREAALHGQVSRQRDSPAGPG